MSLFAPIPLPATDGEALGSETDRLSALHALDLVDSVAEREFDAIVAVATRLLGLPIAAITLVDRERVWIKAIEGSDITEEPRGVAFCATTIGSDDLLVVPDAARDPRFDARVRFYGAHNIRFYAGTPLHAPTGDRIGALCVASESPGSFSSEQAESLQSLAILVDALIAARATARDAIQIAQLSDRQATSLHRQERALQQAQRMAMIGSWRLRLADDTIEWSDNVYRIHGRAVDKTPPLAGALEQYPPHARAIVTEAMARTIETGQPFDIEVDFRTISNAPRRVRVLGELELEGGKPTALLGVLQDVTDRFALEESLRIVANRDELTGIANRAAFNRALDAAIANAHRTRTPLMLALIDLDGFKQINDTLGHLAGDDVLRAVGRRLGQPWLKGSFAARLGGDEFALIVDDPALVADPDGFVALLDADLCVPVSAEGLTIAASGTVGAALLGDDVDTIRDFVHAADTVLYRAKRQRIGERRRAERRGPARAIA